MEGQSCLTLTFESLPGESPQQRPAVLAKGWTLVVVDFEPVRHVDFEALLVHLKRTTQDRDSLALADAGCLHKPLGLKEQLASLQLVLEAFN